MVFRKGCKLVFIDELVFVEVVRLGDIIVSFGGVLEFCGGGIFLYRKLIKFFL